MITESREKVPLNSHSPCLKCHSLDDRDKSPCRSLCVQNVNWFGLIDCDGKSKGKEPLWHLPVPQQPFNQLFYSSRRSRHLYTCWKYEIMENSNVALW